MDIGEARSVELLCLVNDCVDRRGLLAEHGLSILLRTEDKTVLVDAGQTPETFFHNAKRLKVGLKAVNDLIITHGHYDHAGSVTSLSNSLGPSLRILAHPDALEAKFVVKEGKLKHIGVPFKAGGLQSTLTLSKRPTRVAEGVATTGEIWRVMDFEITEDKFVVVKEGERRRDYVMDEQGIIAMVRGRGLLVITGCGHPGVINTVRHAMRMTGVDEVYGVVGGLHLRKAREERIERTIRELRELDPSLIAPCHCTGIRAVSALYREFRDRMRTFHVGDRIRIG